MLPRLAMIPGCSAFHEIDNPRRAGDQHSVERMSKPRAPVHIPLGKLATCEAAAELYSYIAYPDPLEKTERQKFGIAMSRWAVLERAQLEKAFNEATELKPSVRPLVFSQSDQLFLQTYQRGAK